MVTKENKENMGNHTVFYKKVHQSYPKAKILSLQQDDALWKQKIYLELFFLFQVTVYSCVSGLLQIQ